MAILSFNGRVNIAVKIVTEEYPHAFLYEVEGSATEGLTTDPSQINRMRVIFGNAGNTTVIIDETNYGEFGKPVLFNQPWLEDVVIKWPIELDLPEANELKEKAGYKWPYSLVTLRNPLGPVIGNPLFIFGGNPSEPFVFVDTVTKKVSSGMGYSFMGKLTACAPLSACAACTPLSSCSACTPLSSCSACTPLSSCSACTPLSACSACIPSACGACAPVLSACNAQSACQPIGWSKRLF
jgi:hypothetical protein